MDHSHISGTKLSSLDNNDTEEITRDGIKNFT